MLNKKKNYKKLYQQKVNWNRKLPKFNSEKKIQGIN